MTYVIGNQNIVLTICRRKHDCRNKMEFTALSSSLIYGLSSIAILNRLSDSSFDYHKSALNTCSWPVCGNFVCTGRLLKRQDRACHCQPSHRSRSSTAIRLSFDFRSIAANNAGQIELEHHVHLLQLPVIASIHIHISFRMCQDGDIAF